MNTARLILSFIQHIQWTVLILASILLLRRQIVQLIETISVKITKASEISGNVSGGLGGFSFKLSEIERARETLEADLSAAQSEELHQSAARVPVKDLEDTFKGLYTAVAAEVRKIAGGLLPPGGSALHNGIEELTNGLEFNGLIDRSVADGVRALSIIEKALPEETIILGDEALREGIRLANATLARLRRH